MLSFPVPDNQPLVENPTHTPQSLENNRATQCLYFPSTLLLPQYIVVLEFPAAVLLCSRLLIGRLIRAMLELYNE